MKSIQYRAKARVCVVLWILLAGFLLVIGRLAEIQIISHAHYSKKSDLNSMKTLVEPARRGSIYDRYGRPLAISHISHSLYCDPTAIEDDEREDLAKEISAALGKDLGDIKERLSRTSKQFVYLQRFLTPEEEDRLKNVVKKTWGLGFEREWDRFYPTGSSLTPLLGLVSVRHQGLTGLESTYNKQLSGKDGRKVIFKDKRSRQVAILPGSEIPAVDGADLNLTIDRSIQTFLYNHLVEMVKEFNPKSASAVVMDTQTGEILAMVTLPAHEPGKNVPENLEGLKARAVMDVYEPGSTVKPFVYGTLLQLGLCTPEEKLHCANGAKSFGKRVIKDVHPYGELSMEDVIVKSSNIGVAQMAQRVVKSGGGFKALWQVYDAFGFGRTSGLGLAGESKGRLRPPENWSDYSAQSIAMGHEMSVNVVQMCRAYSALANGGFLIQPLLEKSVVKSSGEILSSKKPVRYYRIFSGEVCEKVNRAMEQVVERGTARHASSELFSIAGKTGTTEKFVNGAYSKDHNIAGFVGFAPVKNPRIVVGVMVDEPKGASYGGVVAAPVAQRTIDDTLRYLGVKPDKGKNKGAKVAYAH